MARAIEAVDAAFRSREDETPLRKHIPIDDSELLFMPSWNPRFAGVKLVTVNPTNPERELPLIHGAYLLFERESMQPVALIDAAALTAIRTAAVSGVATRALSAPSARRLVIFGSGVQAHSHLEAMLAVRPISELSVVPRTEESGKRLLDFARTLGLKGSLAYAGEAVSSADIVCTCTTSPEPLFRGVDMDPGAHVNAVGSYKRTTREIDSETVRRATVVAVETLEVMTDSGDLVLPLRERDLSADSVIGLTDALARKKPSHPEITLFKSVGQAFEDLAVAEAAYSALD
jgi:ornithine cyclodeaminase/alanine dehydrogenase-like protein (mu-crystallin family)